MYLFNYNIDQPIYAIVTEAGGTTSMINELPEGQCLDRSMNSPGRWIDTSPAVHALASSAVDPVIWALPRAKKRSSGFLKKRDSNQP